MNDDKARPQPRAQGRVREIAIDDLMPEAREAVLIYKGERYRLRITSNDKLILTK